MAQLDLADTDIISPTDDDVFSYDSSSSKWKNKTAALAKLLALSGGTMTGDINMGNNDIDIGTGSIQTSSYTITGSSGDFTLKRTNFAPQMVLFRDDNTISAGNEAGKIQFKTKNDAATPEDIEYGKIVTTVGDPTDGSEDGKMIFQLIEAGISNTDYFNISAVDQTVNFLKNIDMNGNDVKTEGGDIDIAGGNIINTGTLTLPTSTDTLVGKQTADTLINKTINATNNTITDTSTALGDLLKSNGTKFLRLAKGTSNQVLQTNSGGTDLEYGKINNNNLLSGVFSAITGLGVQSQNLDMGGNTITEIQNLGFDEPSQTINSASGGVDAGLKFNVRIDDKFKFSVGGSTQLVIDKIEMTVDHPTKFNSNVNLGDSSNDSINMTGKVDTDIIIDNAKTIKSHDTEEIGFQVTNDNITVGSQGTVQLPYIEDTDSNPSTTKLNGWYGDKNGCIGIQFDSSASTGSKHRLWFKANLGWQKFET